MLLEIKVPSFEKVLGKFLENQWNIYKRPFSQKSNEMRFCNVLKIFDEFSVKLSNKWITVLRERLSYKYFSEPIKV